MIEEYIKDKNTIILLVIPANIDLTASEGILLAANHDKKKERTLCAATKIDLS